MAIVTEKQRLMDSMTTLDDELKGASV